MNHADFNQNSFRIPAECAQKLFRVIQDSFRVDSDFAQNLVRSNSGAIQNSHSEPFMSYPGVFQVSFSIQLGLIQNEQDKHNII